MCGWLSMTRGWSCKGGSIRRRKTVRFAMVLSRFLRAILLIALLELSAGLTYMLDAQQAKTPTLGEILERLDANLNHYDASVPSFFCDEHAISSQVEPGERDRNTVTDSAFRIKRTAEADHTTSLAEVHEIKSVNGRPATSQKMEGPALASGIFEGGLAVASLNQTACMNYKLQRINKNRPTRPYIISFATVLTAQNSADCFLQEESKGRVYIDPASMQVTHLEITTPRHTIIEGDHFTERVVGKRELTVDYAPVLLGGETFWLPSAIMMRNTSGAGTFHMIVWTFRAAYSNYHRMKVTSSILNGSRDGSH